MASSKKLSTRQINDPYLDLPDEWRNINDIPQVEDMVARLQSDPIFADSFFLQETNNPDNAADGTYQPLTDLQGYLFETLDKNDVIWVQGARGSSKSSAFARWLDGYSLRFSAVKAGLFAPSFRQSKQLHDYCTGYVNVNSNIDSHIYKIENELAKDPTRGAEVKIEFKNGSLIEALPAGDGSKLRGKRYNVICIDEAYLLDKEFHQSHILPMGNVKIGNRPTKVIYLTTSWYSEVYAYEILKNIAARVAAGVPGYAIVDMTLDDVLKSGFPFDKKHILNQLEDQTDKTTGRISDEAKMTFFNIWIKSGSSFYTPSLVQECMRADLPVVAKTPDGDKTPTVIGVDPATIGEDKCAMAVGAVPGNDRRVLQAVYQFEKLMPEAIAGNIHKLVDRYPNTKTILIDKSGQLGIQIADICSREEQLIDGAWVKRTPIMLWDHPEARNSRAQIVLTRPSDERMKTGVIGRRYDANIGGEADLKNTLHLNMKAAMSNGSFMAPKIVKDTDYYDSECGAIMDEIMESLAQFPKIDRKKGPDGKTLIVDARGNFTWTRPMKDDGAYAIVYMNYAAQIHYKVNESRRNEDFVPFLWGGEGSLEKAQRESTHSILLPRL